MCGDLVFPLGRATAAASWKLGAAGSQTHLQREGGRWAGLPRKARRTTCGYLPLFQTNGVFAIPLPCR